MNPLQVPALTANRFQGGCPNCGYGTSLKGRCPYCLVSNNSDMDRSFQEAINSNPHDAAPHLIYADYLDEHNLPEESKYHRNIGEGISSSEYHELVNRNPEAVETHQAIRNYLGRNGGDINLNWILGRLVEDNLNNTSHRQVFRDYLRSKNQHTAAEMHDQVLRAMRGGSRFVTREVAPRFGYRSELYHITARNRDGTAARARINGALKTWKTRPEDFRLPVKHGLRDTFYITPNNQYEWMTHDITEY